MNKIFAYGISVFILLGFLIIPGCIENEETPQATYDMVQIERTLEVPIKLKQKVNTGNDAKEVTAFVYDGHGDKFFGKTISEDGLLTFDTIFTNGRYYIFCYTAKNTYGFCENVHLNYGLGSDIDNSCHQLFGGVCNNTVNVECSTEMLEYELEPITIMDAGSYELRVYDNNQVSISNYGSAHGTVVLLRLVDTLKYADVDVISADGGITSGVISKYDGLKVYLTLDNVALITIRVLEHGTGNDIHPSTIEVCVDDLDGNVRNLTDDGNVYADGAKRICKRMDEY